MRRSRQSSVVKRITQRLNPRVAWLVAWRSRHRKPLRFPDRIDDLLTQCKLSPMDLESQHRKEACTVGNAVMMERSHNAQAPWWVLQAVDKRCARG